MNYIFVRQNDLLNVTKKNIFLKARAESNYSFDYELNDVEVFKDENQELKLFDKKLKGIS